MADDLELGRDKKVESAPVHWSRAAFVLACFVAGFAGGWLAPIVRERSLLQNSTGQQVVSKESEVISDVVDKVSDSVVSISVRSRRVSNDPFFGRQVLEGESAGTGIILTDEGLVVTNKHVIGESAATDLTIIAADGTEYEDLEIIGRDPFMDVAFLKIKGGRNLKPAKLGSSDDMRVGDKVIAIGNALGEFDHTVTSGIISGTGRPVTAGSGNTSEQLQNLFQTDAAINPGNSGGPLMNLNGEVIGINTAVASDSENIGFAIPINDVKPAVTSVKEQGKLVRPYLGVRYVLLTDDIAKELKLDVTEGAAVIAGQGARAVIADSPADKAGILANDVITKVEDTAITTKNGLVTVVSRYQVGEKITLTINRKGKEIKVEVTLEAVPGDLTN